MFYSSGSFFVHKHCRFALKRGKKKWCVSSSLSSSHFQHLKFSSFTNILLAVREYPFLLCTENHHGWVFFSSTTYRFFRTQNMRVLINFSSSFRFKFERNGSSLSLSLSPLRWITNYYYHARKEIGREREEP